MTLDSKLLAAAWIDYFSEYQRTGKFPDNNSSLAVDHLTRANPEIAWEVILEILRAIEPEQENPLFQVLAAGPLEDLLSDHGPRIVERVEILASRDPIFNLLLGGVWQGGMLPDIWSRVEACRRSAW